MTALPPLYLITDAAGYGEEACIRRARQAVSGGLRWIQVREPDWEDAGIERLVRRLREEVPEVSSGEVRIVLGRRPALALHLGLDGAHVGGGRIEDVQRAREILGPRLLVGYSAHTVEEVPQALEAGASYVSFSPVFGAISKVHPLAPVGLGGLRRACASCAIPVYALGGVTPAAAGDLRRAGAAGGAMIGSILGARDPGLAARDFLSRWEAASDTRTPARSPEECEPER